MFDKYLKWGGLGAVICAKTLIAASHPDSLILQGTVKPISNLQAVSQESIENGVVTEFQISNNNISGYSVQLSSSDPEVSDEYSIKVVKVSPQQTENALLEDTSLTSPKAVTESNPKEASIGTRYRVYITNNAAHSLNDTLVVRLSDSTDADNTIEVPFSLPAAFAN